MTLEQRVSNLEHYLTVLISSNNLKETYNNYDKEALRNADSTQGESIAQNTADIDYIKIMEDL